MREIKIEQKEIKVVSKITIDGVEFPLHRWNVDVANEYLADGDEKCLEKLKDFSLELTAKFN